MLVELNSSNVTTARYTFGDGLDEVLSVRRSGATYLYLHDKQNSVVRILDQSRVVKNSYEYKPWGDIRTQSETITNRYTYTGRERNPDGRTLHYRARTYLPQLGRFAQEDPLGFVDGVNLYRYVANSPCTFVDPYGLCIKQIGRAMAGTAVVATVAMVVAGPGAPAVGATYLSVGLPTSFGLGVLWCALDKLAGKE